MAKPTEGGSTGRLAERWNAPSSSSLPADGAGKPVVCIATTYEFHASLFEADLLPRFLGLRFDSNERERAFVVERERALGTSRVCVLVDQDHVDASQTTLRWDQLPVDVPRGVQHAKLVLLLWQRSLRLIVSSANLTRSGYRRNREIASALDFFDDSTSAPRRLAIEAVDFIRELIDTGWIRAGREAVGRLDQGLTDIRRHLASWRQMPADFAPRARPKAVFVPGRPGGGGMAARSPLKQLLQHWGTARADEVAVLTPFVGESAEGQARVIAALMRLPRSKQAVGALVVPGVRSEKDANRTVVPLPAWFRASWASAWQQPVHAVPTYVVQPFDQERPRALHAKAIFIANDDRAVLLCGSSNFSPHGMGVGAANLEANLCYVDNSRKRLSKALPLDLHDDPTRATVWQDLQAPPEDRVAGRRRLPPVFSSAVLDQHHGALTFLFDAAYPLPSEWSICVSASEAADAVLLGHHELPELPADGTHTLVRDTFGGPTAITCVTVRWRDVGDGPTWSSMMPVHAVSAESIRPLEEFRSLTAEAILRCLISGRSPEELVPDGPTSKNRSHRVGDVDSLRSVDTSGYPTYRSRLLGRALATLASRIVETIRTETAVTHRLFEDPLGPLSLAKAVVSQQKAEVAAGDRFGLAYAQFALAEIQLTLAYAGKQVHATRAPYEPDLRTIFANAIRQVDRLRTDDLKLRDEQTDSASVYGKRVRAHCADLLGLPGGVHVA